MPIVSPLELRQLRYFVAVADAAQLTDAARRLNIAQPTLSQALSQLEAQLGVELLERHSRGVRLTDAGRVFLEKARTAVAAADDAAETVGAFVRTRSLTLAVGFEGQPLGRWAPLFHRLCSEHPAAHVSWQRLGFPREGQAPLDGVDVALLTAPTPHPGLATLVLQRDPVVVMMGAGHPLAERQELKVADVLDETFLAADPSVDRRWNSVWSLDRERGGPAVVTDENIATAEEGADLVAAGRAIATATASLGAAYPHPGIVTIPLADADPVPICLVWQEQHPNPLVDALVAIAQETVAASA
jgi:DNA-binding transcriptional LysR family regulator